MPNTSFYSNGKLLLTGEYLVLDGAKALALPTKYGQHLIVESNNSDSLQWKSIDHNGQIWFEEQFNLNDFKILNHVSRTSTSVQHDSISKRLFEILKAAKQLNPDFLNTGYIVETKLTFPSDWGLGSSSTLIHNLAQWAQIDPYQLLELTFGGSGYDIACAKYNKPITYNLIDNSREVQTVDFKPDFKDCLYFVYLNKKQNSRDAIEAYRRNIVDKSEAITSIDKITKDIITCNNLSEFNDLIAHHEKIIGTILKQEPIKTRLFSDFQGAIKSLGAWGGDFILVTSIENPSTYFKAKGFKTVIPYEKLILK